MNLSQFLDVKKWERYLKICNNIYENNVIFNKLSVKEKKLLLDNAKYKEKYKGQPCYVLGNGPSVNNIDFEILSNKLVITVNDMFRHDEFLKLNSNFHFIADPMYLNLNRRSAADKEVIEKMHLLSLTDTVLFFPISGLNSVKKYKWEKRLHIQYFASKLSFYDNYKENIDFTRFIPCFQAVIHWCIAFAIYMGCSEIYLLGCDATNIITDISLFANANGNLDYAYNLSKETAESVRKKHMKLGLENTLYGYWKIVHIFSELYRYCERHNIKLYNCSEKSILKNIPQKNFSSINLNKVYNKEK